MVKSPYCSCRTSDWTPFPAPTSGSSQGTWGSKLTQAHTQKERRLKSSGEKRREALEKAPYSQPQPPDTQTHAHSSTMCGHAHTTHKKIIQIKKPLAST